MTVHVVFFFWSFSFASQSDFICSSELNTVTTSSWHLLQCPWTGLGAHNTLLYLHLSSNVILCVKIYAYPFPYWTGPAQCLDNSGYRKNKLFYLIIIIQELNCIIARRAIPRFNAVCLKYSIALYGLFYGWAFCQCYLLQTKYWFSSKMEYHIQNSLCHCFYVNFCLAHLLYWHYLSKNKTRILNSEVFKIEIN